MRLFYLLAYQLSAGLLGWWLATLAFVHAPLHGAWVGAVAGSMLWLLLDARGLVRLLEWLRQGDTKSDIKLAGLWRGVHERVRKLLRERERVAHESDERLQHFLEALQASPNGVVLLDANNAIEWFNQTASSHFGFQTGRDLLQHIGNLVRDPGFAHYLAERDFGKSLVMPGHAATASHPARISLQIHPYREGRSLLLSRDITALEQAEVMRRDFVANVSHEIRTPLTVVSGFVETLRSLPQDEKQRQRYLDLVAQQTHRMETLIGDLLTLSRLEGSPPVIRNVWQPLSAVLRGLVGEAVELSATLARAEQPQHRIELMPWAAFKNFEIGGAPIELHSAFSNLVGNAVRYTPAHGLVQIGWRVLGDGRGEFSVQDSGPGIDAEHVPRLTERFYRVDSSRSRDTGGTGLGLAIVKHVAQRHGVELVIDTKPGAGSTFRLLFPSSRVRVMAAEPATQVVSG